jgi:hypothetical protein
MVLVLFGRTTATALSAGCRFEALRVAVQGERQHLLGVGLEVDVYFGTVPGLKSSHDPPASLPAKRDFAGGWYLFHASHFSLTKQPIGASND